MRRWIEDCRITYHNAKAGATPLLVVALVVLLDPDVYTMYALVPLDALGEESHQMDGSPFLSLILYFASV